MPASVNLPVSLPRDSQLSQGYYGNALGRVDGLGYADTYLRLRNIALDAARRNNAALYFSEDPVLGPELVVNGGFDSDTAWTKGTGWTISGGVATHVAGTQANLSQVGALTVGKSYRMTVNVKSVTGNVVMFIGSGTARAISATGESEFSGVCAGTPDVIVQSQGATGACEIESVSVREILNADLYGYQDAAGTLPSYLGGPMGLWLDKSYGLERGAELVTNGDFSNGTTGWTAASTITPTVSGGVVTLARNGASGAANCFSQTITTVVGRSYRISFNVVSGTAVYNNANIGNVITSSPNSSATFTAVSTTTWINFWPLNDLTSVQLNNISVRELKGVHLTQATAGAKPTAAKPVKYPLLSCDGGDSLAAPSSIIGSNLSQPYTMIASGVVGALGATRAMVGDQARVMGIDAASLFELANRGGGTSLKGRTAVQGESFVLASTFDASSAKLFLNGTQAATASNPVAPFAAAGATMIGQTGLGTYYWNSNLDLQCIAPAVMPDADRKAIERFAAFRLNVTYAG